MNLQTDCGFARKLTCEICNYVEFSSYEEFYGHHLIHVRQPSVRLVKLNSKLCAKLQIKSYKINKGVARRSHPRHVPPLKISLVKHQGANQFQVKNKDNCQDLKENILGLQEHYFNHNSDSNFKGHKANKSFVEDTGTSEVEGKNLLERFGAQISVSRKGKPGSPALSGNGNNESEASIQNSDAKAENVLERLSGIGGISILPKVKSSSNGNSDSKPSSGISISSKLKSIDLNELKKFKEQDSENEKKLLDRNIILRKLSGSGSISIASKIQAKSGSLKEEQESVKEDKERISPRPGSHESFERLGMIGQLNSQTDNLDLKSMESTAEGHAKSLNENSSESTEQKKFVRVKNSTFKKRPPISHSPKESSEESTGTPEEPKEPPARRESGVDILERLTENLNSAVKAKSGENSEDSTSEKMEEPLLASVSGGDIRSESSGSRLEGKDSQLNVSNESNEQRQEQECALLLTPPGSSCQDGEGEDFSTLNSHTSDFGDSNNERRNSSEITANETDSFHLTGEDESHETSEQQNNFWSDMPNSSKSIDQPTQDPLLTSDNSVPNGEGLNQNFLHNFLSEPQSSSNNIPPENSEFMSLDRLAQTQHQKPPFNMSSPESNTPMEQLSQQVQRIPNPPPQINVISQHHMQAPQPPQMHTGVPISPQHISPQQPNSYEALGHMQPPIPPPLYQGYNMYNQSFPPQTPQQMPRPPILQQRPHIQPRSFQSLAAPRPRVRPMKRNSIRLPSPEMAPPKQLRMEHSPLQTRPQLPNTTTKLPSGITITPPKKALEANKVANVLASRGITVTPAASRQTNQVPRPQQRNPSPNLAPTLNISSAVSITSSSQNRNNGGFAVPGPRRATPLVNHHVDRPERCTTVDLTMDDEAGSHVRMGQPQIIRGVPRYTCKACGKIFSSAFTLESHMSTHRTYKCDKCNASYPMLVQLQQHRYTFHKVRQQSPDLAIPIVDLNHPGAREQLAKCGIQNYIPMAQLQSNNNGYFGVPIIQLDTAKEKAVSNLGILGAGNILVLGKMKALVP